ncbi:primosomal protein DnaI [Vagococcus penaei]|uniref:Primosomal protein DnaI n=1 Tax=Vagococcus penaei TaxID=633807 RepID=A0A1Q2D3D8_9ENTE|nr:primosomal protein DnaI [Vagococcus penaei]AQP52884.1 primosomal protein DnaI [Vagococcus penaei]RSU01373.1 primosomal protein DnaI [Vagococcus penaei]
MNNIGKELGQKMTNKSRMEKFQKLRQITFEDADVKAFIDKHRDVLTEDDVEKSLSKLFEFIQEKRKFQLNDPTMFAPGYEPQLFLNFHYIDVTYVPTKDLLEQKRQQEIKNRVKAVDMPKDIQEATLSGFEMTTERKEALQLALKFINDYEDNPKAFHQGLYLQGAFGVGKTYLLGAIANTLAEKGYRTTLIHFPTFAVEMKNSIKTDNVFDKLDTIKKSPILMIDDIGADAMSSWVRDDILGVILQYRMQEQLPTFFSSNFDRQQLEHEHLRVTQRGEDEPMKAKRIMERIRYLTKEVNMIGQNRRNY